MIAVPLLAGLIGPRALVLTPLISDWVCHGRVPSHVAQTFQDTDSVSSIVWSVPVDMNPSYSGNDLLTHYGSPLISSKDTVIVPTKTGLNGGYTVYAYNGGPGPNANLQGYYWKFDTDYILPNHNWIPSYGPCLTKPRAARYQNVVAFPMAGGRVGFRNADYPSAPVRVVSFYGLGNYNANPSAYNSSIFIDTPLTPDADGDVYFGYVVQGSNPLNIKSGIARVSYLGQGTYVSASAAAGDAGISQVQMNSAPAMDGSLRSLYVPVSTGNFGRGYLLRLSTKSLATINKVALKDPKTGNDAAISDDGTASPVVGPDGDVYFGVLENPFPSNHARGWLLHFSSDLNTLKIPGAFGWDDTPSIIPTLDFAPILLYMYGIQYCVISKYNNYYSAGGDGVNQVACLIPTVAAADPVSGIQTMAVYESVVGPTADTTAQMAGYPNAVREWCINSAAVDEKKGAVILNSEDGYAYRWDLVSGSLSEKIQLTSGIGEAYTMTVIGPNGNVYAISNGNLYCIGSAHSN